MGRARKTNKLGLSAPNSNLERVKRNQQNTMMMGSSAVSHADDDGFWRVKGKRNKSSSSYKFSTSGNRNNLSRFRCRNPLSFYTDSAVNDRVPILKGNKSIPLSSYNTTAVYQPAPGGESKMDIFLVNENEEFLPNYVKCLKIYPLWFYFYRYPTVSIPGLRINYRPAPTAGAKSSDPKSVPKIIFGSQSSESKVIESSESKVIFRCFGSQSSESKVSCVSSTSSESPSSESNVSCVSSTSSESRSSESKSDSTFSFGSQSSESKVSCFSSTSSESPSSESKSESVAKIIFGSFGSQSSESKVIESSKSKVSRNPIPDKVAFSILSKLSIKSLKRFGCIRKSWSILFENTDFMTMYSKHFVSGHGSDDDYHTFIFSKDNLEFQLLEKGLKLDLPSPVQPTYYNACILGSASANGIFCIGQLLRSRKSRYVLWNPLTGEFMEVPPSPAELIPIQPSDQLFVNYTFHGFGYDQRRDDFKVIQHLFFQDTIFTNMVIGFFEIYSLKSNSWRMFYMNQDFCPLVEFDLHDSMPFLGLEVYVDGSCHWLASKFDGTILAMTLLSFDLSNEVFFITPIGEERFPLYDVDQRLTVLNESIALILNYQHDDIVFDISILGELGVSESWIKLYIYGPLPSIQWPPIGFGKMGYIFFRKEDDEVAYVDLSTQIIKEVDIFISSQIRGFIGGLYKKSILSIGGSSN